MVGSGRDMPRRRSRRLAGLNPASGSSGVVRSSQSLSGTDCSQSTVTPSSTSSSNPDLAEAPTTSEDPQCSVINQRTEGPNQNQSNDIPERNETVHCQANVSNVSTSEPSTSGSSGNFARRKLRSKCPHEPPKSTSATENCSANDCETPNPVCTSDMSPRDESNANITVQTKPGTSTEGPSVVVTSSCVRTQPSTHGTTSSTMSSSSSSSSSNGNVNTGAPDVGSTTCHGRHLRGREWHRRHRVRSLINGQRSHIQTSLRTTYSEGLREAMPVRGESYCTCPQLSQSRDLQCSCGEEDTVFEWQWDKSSKSSASDLTDDQREVRFHVNYSSGTAAVRGSQTMTDRQHFWEIKMTTPVYGTDMMVGVGTQVADLDAYRYSFCSLLGRDGESWGLSYYGRIQHKGNFINLQGSRFGQGSIVGVHLDMWRGILSFYKNRRPLGVGYTGLSGKVLYPMVSSTAARTGMRLIKACSFQTSLQFLCCQVLRQIVPAHLDVIDALKLPPGLQAFLTNNLGWLLRPNELSAPAPAAGSAAAESQGRGGGGGGSQTFLPRKSTWYQMEHAGGSSSSDDEDEDLEGFELMQGRKGPRAKRRRREQLMESGQSAAGEDRRDGARLDDYELTHARRLPLRGRRRRHQLYEEEEEEERMGGDEEEETSSDEAFLRAVARVRTSAPSQAPSSSSAASSSQPNS